MVKLSHIDDAGAARMVDISGKPPTKRLAIAKATVHVSAETLDAIRENTTRKGDVLAVARIAGIAGAKKTSDLVPLCHPIPLTSVKVDFDLRDNPASILIEAQVSTTGSTGVEMEALTAVSIAAITIYDMIKSADRGASVTDMHVSLKEGGKSGRYESTR